MTIFSIILNYKTKDETLRCVKSLQNTLIPSYVNHKIIIVDNASNDGIERALSADHPDTIFLQTGSNLGYTGGHNYAINWIAQTLQGEDEKKISQTFVFILNNDTTFHENCLVELLKAFQRHPQAGILTPKIYFDPQHLPSTIKDSQNQTQPQQDQIKADPEKSKKIIWYAGGVFDKANVLGQHRGVDQLDEGQYDQESIIEYASGCAMLIPFSLFKSLNGFDNNYFMYYEDVDLSFQVKKHQKEIWYIPTAKMWHSNASSAGLASPLQNYFTTRNRLYFGFKWLSWRTRIALLREAFRLRSDAQKSKAVRDFLLFRFGKGSFIK
jgi:GT2 family glycosyltransferase